MGGEVPVGGADEPDDDDRAHPSDRAMGATMSRPAAWEFPADDEQDDGVHPHVVGQDAREAVLQALQGGRGRPSRSSGDPGDGEHGGGPALNTAVEAILACTLQVSRISARRRA